MKHYVTHSTIPELNMPLVMKINIKLYYFDHQSFVSQNRHYLKPKVICIFYKGSYKVYFTYPISKPLSLDTFLIKMI